MFVLQNRDSRL